LLKARVVIWLVPVYGREQSAPPEVDPNTNWYCKTWEPESHANVCVGPVRSDPDGVGLIRLAGAGAFVTLITCETGVAAA
jgi:hypothetical protein